MTQIRNTTESNRSIQGAGPFVAEIISHLDSERMGALKVSIISGTAGNPGATEGISAVVDYLPPFFGNTPYSSLDANARNASSTQSSYGFWMIPPDIGTKVLVMFVEGDINRGYWIGCIPEKNMNHMVPGIAASTSVELTPQEKVRLGTDTVPVSEYNRWMTDKTGTTDTDKIKKPMHPFTMRLAEQGLLKDPIRGVTTSSARRELPSAVFGISTPGPPVFNNGAKTYNVGNKANPTKVYTYREGGTQFVMDDGTTSVDEKTGKRGTVDEMVRIRTRTGHQILMHNSSDLIYIANAKGSAWLEMTSDGKIDIYAADSVSIHSENDFNFRADRDVNIEAGRNFNVRSVSGSHIEAGGWIQMISAHEIDLTSNKHFNINANGKLRLTATINPASVTLPTDPAGVDIYSLGGNINMFSTLQTKIQTPSSMSIKSGLGLTVMSGASTTIQTGAEFVVKTVGINYIDGASNIFTAKAAHIERAATIDMNGPTPAPESTTSITNLATAIEALSLLPQFSTTVVFLTKHTLPYREANKNANATTQKGWENNNYYRQPDISSIMKRVPTHEPYDHHESIDPTLFKPEKTDREF